MTPKQSSYNPNSKGCGEEAELPSEGYFLGDEGGGDLGRPDQPENPRTLEVMQLAISILQTSVYASWVSLLENDPSYACRPDITRAVLDSLVDIAHVAHGFLRHGDPHVRDAAEAITTSTAYLIGRVYWKF